MIFRKSWLRGALCLALFGSIAYAQPDRRASKADNAKEADEQPSSAPSTTGPTDSSTGASIPSGSSLRIAWQGPEECGEPTDLEDETRRLLGKSADAAGVAVSGSARRLSDGRYRVELHLTGAVTGVRNLESSECREAIQAAAVVLALAINSEALLAGEGRESEEPQPPKEPEVVPSPPEEPAASPPPAPRVRLILAVAARLSGGIAPFPQLGGRFSLGADYLGFRAVLKGIVEPQRRHTLQPTGSYSLSTLGGALDLCAPAFETMLLVSRICGGLSGTQITASPEGLTPNRKRRAFVLAPTIGGEVAVLLGENVALIGGGGFQIPTTYPAFTVDGPEPEVTTAHTVSLGGYGELGVELLF